MPAQNAPADVPPRSSGRCRAPPRRPPRPLPGPTTSCPSDGPHRALPRSRGSPLPRSVRPRPSSGRALPCPDVGPVRGTRPPRPARAFARIRAGTTLRNSTPSKRRLRGIPDVFTPPAWSFQRKGDHAKLRVFCGVDSLLVASRSPRSPGRAVHPGSRAESGLYGRIRPYTHEHARATAPPVISLENAVATSNPGTTDEDEAGIPGRVRFVMEPPTVHTSSGLPTRSAPPSAPTP